MGSGGSAFSRLLIYKGLMMTNHTKNLWTGVSDALGFVAGALLGFGAGKLLGFDAFAQGYDNQSIFAIVLIGLGGGLGLNLARRWQNRHLK
jgi:hypothetical protein